MPIYVYRCPTCDEELETFQGMDDPPPPCPNSEEHETMERKPVASAFHLKGKGWERDGYS